MGNLSETGGAVPLKGNYGLVSDASSIDPAGVTEGTGKNNPNAKDIG